MAGSWVRWRLFGFEIVDVVGLGYSILGCAGIGDRASPTRAAEDVLTCPEFTNRILSADACGPC